MFRVSGDLFSWENSVEQKEENLVQFCLEYLKEAQE